MKSEVEIPSLSSLVPLSDGRPGLRRGLQVEVREPDDSTIQRFNDSTAVLDFIASDETLDRYDEVITATGWKLESYQRNPVFQNAHKYGDIIFTLGKALVTEVRTVGRLPSGGDCQVLFQRVEFATEVNPMARIAYGLYKGKFLNAVSVGFIPIRWEDPSDLNPNLSLNLNQPRRRYLEQELLEVSAVDIPANPNALSLALKSGAIETSDLRDLADLIHQALAPSPSPLRLGRGEGQGEVSLRSTTPPLHHSTPHALLSLARDLHQILRHT